MMLELSVVTGRPLAELLELDEAELATLGAIAEDLGRAVDRG